MEQNPKAILVKQTGIPKFILFIDRYFQYNLFIVIACRMIMFNIELILYFFHKKIYKHLYQITRNHFLKAIQKCENMYIQKFVIFFNHISRFATIRLIQNVTRIIINISWIMGLSTKRRYLSNLLKTFLLISYESHYYIIIFIDYFNISDVCVLRANDAIMKRMFRRQTLHKIMTSTSVILTTCGNIREDTKGITQQ